MADTARAAEIRITTVTRVIRVKSSKLIIGCLIGVGLVCGQAMAEDSADLDAIAERLEPVGEVCLKGEGCGTLGAAITSNTVASGGAVDGESIYGRVCMACHDTGAAGAPRRGEEADWAERSAKGFETLLDHALNGFNAMPARGGNPNLSDEEVRASVAYLVEPIMEVPATEDSASTEDQDPAANADNGEDTATDEAAVASEQSGDDATAAESAEVDVAATAGIDGQAVYESVCFACHDTGAAGAPKRGDAAIWEPRLAEGRETLYSHAINGLNAMPPKGGRPSLSDEEVKAAVDYMVQ